MDYASTGMLKSYLWMPVFNIGFGLDPVLLGVILMIFRGWDAVTDPLMGNISDNTHTRWGRRRPYMFFAAISTALLYPLFWYMPFEWSDHAKSIYLTIVGIIFFTSFTCWSMPYYSLQMELTPNYDERSRLTAWMAFTAKIYSLGASWFVSIVMVVGALALGHAEEFQGKGAFFAKYLEPFQPFFQAMPGVDSQAPTIVVGIRIMCWFFAFFFMVLGVLPALFVKERYYEKMTKTQAREPFWQSIRESLSCKPLWVLIAASFFLILGSTLVASLGGYVNIYYVNGGDLTQSSVINGWKGTISVGLGILMLPLLVKLAEYFDKNRVAVSVLTFGVVAHASGYFFITPDNPYLQIISSVAEGLMLSSFYMFLPSMKADVADYDEHVTKRRREGSINSFYSWFTKVAGTLAVGGGGVVLSLTGFDVSASGQPHGVLMKMFHWYLIIPICFWSISIVCLLFYPLNRQRSAKIREDLEARRGQV